MAAHVAKESLPRPEPLPALAAGLRDLLRLLPLRSAHPLPPSRSGHRRRLGTTRLRHRLQLLDLRPMIGSVRDAAALVGAGGYGGGGASWWWQVCRRWPRSVGGKSHDSPYVPAAAAAVLSLSLSPLSISCKARCCCCYNQHDCTAVA